MKTRRIVLVSFLWVVAALGSGQANAQSQDRDSPTPLTSGLIEGAGGDQKTVYYYAFEGGPGKVSASLEAKTKKGAKSASVGIELFDASAKSLTSTLLEEGLGGGREKLDQLIGNGLGRLTSSLGSLNGDTKQKSSSVKLKEKQTLTLRVAVGQGIETYTVKLEGAVEFGQPAAAADQAQPATPATEPSSTQGSTDSAAPPTEPPPPAEPQAPVEQAPVEQAPAEQAPVANPKPPIVKIPGKSNQKPAIIKIPGKKPPQ